MRGVVRAFAAAAERVKKATTLAKEGMAMQVERVKRGSVGVDKEKVVKLLMNDRRACIEQVEACKESD